MSKNGAKFEQTAEDGSVKQQDAILFTGDLQSVKKAREVLSAEIPDADLVQVRRRMLSTAQGHHDKFEQTLAQQQDEFSKLFAKNKMTYKYGLEN